MPTIYDVARQHFEAAHYPTALPIEAAYLHIGVFLGWAIEENLISDAFEEDFMLKIRHFKNREVSCTVISALWDGYITDEMLNRDGRSFAESYYLTGFYLKDYHKLYPKASTIYHIEDTWEHYEKVKAHLSEKYREWREENRQKNRS